MIELKTADFLFLTIDFSGAFFSLMALGQSKSCKTSSLAAG